MIGRETLEDGNFETVPRNFDPVSMLRRFNYAVG